MSTVTTTMTSIWKKGSPQPPIGGSKLYMPAAAPPPSSSPASTTLSTVPSSPSSSPLKKRKNVGSSTENPAPKRVRVKHKTKKRAKDSDGGSEADPASLPEPIFFASSSSSRSRSTSTPLAPRKTRKLAVDRPYNTDSPRLSSYDTIKPLLRTYKSFFHNPDDPDDWTWKPHPDRPPIGELEYPNDQATEEFMLVEPKDKDHYNPVFDLENALYSIIANYMTPDQQRQFGTLPRTDFQFEDDENEFQRSLSPPGPPKPLHIFRRAINTRNGPLFISALNEINKLIRNLKYPSLPNDMFDDPERNSLMYSISTWNQIPKKVLLQILEENYQRSVGPHVASLRQYEAFSSEVYGELMPSLFYEIIESCNLDENSLFLDLGSGVGNLVVQASLQTGCRSYGIELQESASRVAEKMVQHFRSRCAMWGLKCGDIQVERGSMLESARVDEYIKEADLVVVDNKMFKEVLNESLKPKFLDLKDGAIVISLKPFSAVNARVTERNLDDMSAIFEVEERFYRSGDVSWGNKPGSYYVHTVNRNSYADTRSRFEQSRSSSSRRSRTSR
ncbi:S-adenosyl-L-methionine-dependent methyltransferase [Mucidula mucida]|nr:S-adenosyl-L-methionine-dependent methyltransferase [Mucidula mucida]